MGKIKKLLENELVGGTQSTDIYPVTSIKAVYDENNERLDHIINRKGVINISTNYNPDHIVEELTLSEAILKVPDSDRVTGFIGSFKSSTGWMVYQFRGESVSSDWRNNSKWAPIGDIKHDLGNSEISSISQKSASNNLHPYLFSTRTNRSGYNDDIILNSIKSIKLLGKWDKSKDYFIDQISNNSPTDKDRFVISSIDSEGNVSLEYDTSVNYEILDKTKYHIFPILNGKRVEAKIDFSVISNKVDVHSTSNLSIRSSVINTEDINDYPIFLIKNISIYSEKEVALIRAVKSITLIGDWDASKTYAIDEISRNDATEKYRLSIKEINPETGELVKIVYDSYRVEFQEEEGINIIKYPLVNNKQAIITLDYSILNNGRYYFYNNLIINNSNVVITAKLPEVIFYNAKLGLQDTPLSNSIISSIKDVQFYGNWDLSKRYKIDTLARNGLSYKYRCVIETEDGQELYDTGLSTEVQEEGEGKYTYVDFGLKNGMGVRMVIDYNSIPEGDNVIGGYCNYVFSSSVFTSSASEISSDTHEGGDIGTVIDSFSKSDLIPAFQNQDRSKQIVTGTTSKKGFICMRSDDTPRIDMEWIKLLDTYNLKYTLCANVPYYSGSDMSIIRDIQQSGHEVCDHTCFHTTFYAHVPEKYMKFFQKYIDSGDITRVQDDTASGIFGKRITFKTHVKENYSEHKFGGDKSFKLTAGSNKITGNFTDIPGGNTPLVYIDNLNGDKIGWILASKEDNQTIIITNNDGTSPVVSQDENIDMYAVAPTIDNYTLTEDATYCLLLSGQCWFNQAGLKKPMVWNQPGGVMPFVDREILSRVIKRLGMRGGETDKTLAEGAVATFNYYTPYPFVTYNWEGGDLHFDECDGSDEWLNRVKGLISDYVSKRNIRTLATHFIYDNFPGSNTEEKRKNYLIWFDKLFRWISEAGIEMLTLEERDLVLDYTETNRYANVFPELYYDRAKRNKPDGYTIENGNVTWTNDGRPESKNKALSIRGNGNFFKVTNLGGLEKGRCILSFFAKSSSTGSILTVKTSQGQTIPSWNQENYTETSQDFNFEDIHTWKYYEIDLDIPYTMNYINIEMTVQSNDNEVVSISGISLRGK